MSTPSQYPALQLNADFRPLSRVPPPLLSWQEAVKLVVSDRAILLEQHDFVVRSPGRERGKPFEMKLPSVIALRDYRPMNRPAAFTRNSLAVRDEFSCAYCRKLLGTKEITFDHVVPKSKGGKGGFENIVCACEPCNSFKANRTLKECKFTLHAEPWTPTWEDLNAIGAKFPPDPALLHRAWLPYLGLPDDYLGPARVTSGPVPDGAAFPGDMTSADYWNVEVED